METQEDKKRRLARERKRAQRERERAARQSAKDVTPNYVRASFAEYLREQSIVFDESLHFTGVLVTGSLADEDHSGCYPGGAQWEEIMDLPLNSLNRATAMIGGFLDAAHELAKLVNEFKRQEIEHRIAEAEASSPDGQAPEELHAIRTTLRREEQHRFPRYHVKGH